MSVTTRLNSRDRVLAAFDRKQFDRAPIWCGVTPEFWTRAVKELGVDDEGVHSRLGDDVRRIYAIVQRPERLTAGALGRTLFGVDRHVPGVGVLTSHPLAHSTLDQIAKYAWPDPNWGIQLVGGPQIKAHQYAAIGGLCNGFWHDLIDLVGVEETLAKMQDEPVVIDTILQRIVDYYVAVNRKILAASGSLADLFIVANDFGSGGGLALTDALFRRFIAPHLRRLVILGHDYGLRVMLQGGHPIPELLGAILETGVDAVSLALMERPDGDLAGLKAELGDQVLINGISQIQRVLREGTPDQVREKTRQTLEVLMPGGGFLAGTAHESILADTPVENVLAMCETIRQHGTYC